MDIFLFLGFDYGDNSLIILYFVVLGIINQKKLIGYNHIIISYKKLLESLYKIRHR